MIGWPSSECDSSFSPSLCCFLVQVKQENSNLQNKSKKLDLTIKDSQSILSEVPNEMKPEQSTPSTVCHTCLFGRFVSPPTPSPASDVFWFTTTVKSLSDLIDSIIEDTRLLAEAKSKTDKALKDQKITIDEEGIDSDSFKVSQGDPNSKSPAKDVKKLNRYLKS